MGSCLSVLKPGSSKSHTHDDDGKEIRRVTSYHGSVADPIRYSDRAQQAERERLSASDLHRARTAEQRLRKAEAMAATTSPAAPAGVASAA